MSSCIEIILLKGGLKQNIGLNWNHLDEESNTRRRAIKIMKLKQSYNVWRSILKVHFQLTNGNISLKLSKKLKHLAGSKFYQKARRVPNHSNSTCCTSFLEISSQSKPSLLICSYQISSTSIRNLRRKKPQVNT